MEDFEKNEQSVDEVVETVDETLAEDNSAEENTDNFGEIVDETVGETVESTVDEPEVSEEPALGDAEISELESVPAKKKMKVQTPIIIAACVLLVAILGFACFRLFFVNSVVGTWVIDDTSTSDEAATGESTEASTSVDDVRYYTFEKDGTASISLGTMKVVGTWSYANEDSSTTDQAGNKIKVEISYFFNGVFDIELGGNAFSGRTMNLSGENLIKPITFKSATIPESDLKPSEKFKENKAITGKWKNSEYNLTYTFNSDGTCNLNQVDTLIVDGVYTVNSKDNTIEITYMEAEKDTMSIEFAANKKNADKITFSGLEYEKVKE